MTQESREKDRPHAYRHPHPAVAVDVATFAIQDGELCVLLVERGVDPFKGSWALPGGFLKPTEDLLEAAQREVLEETGLANVPALQIGAFGKPDRDPRERVVSIAFIAVVRAEAVHLRAGTDAVRAGWHALERLPRLAFDHADILKRGREHLVEQLKLSDLSLAFLPEEFTLTDLQGVHEAVLGAAIDKRNFRAWIATCGLLKETKKQRVGGRHRPARLYRRHGKNLVRGG